MAENIRIDKFLWSVRLFKTRNLAAAACEKHHVLIGNMPVKPSRMVKVGDVLIVKKLPVYYSYEVMGLIDKRQPALLVKGYIRDITSQEELNKLELAKIPAFGQRDRGTGRPSKKERRDIEKLMH